MMKTKFRSPFALWAFLVLFSAATLLTFLPHEHFGKAHHSHSASDACLLCQWNQNSKTDLPTPILASAPSEIEPFVFSSYNNSLPEPFRNPVTGRSPPRLA